MAIYIYRSTDTSSPILNGTAGSLINVLDACLVNGYDAKAGMGQTKPYSGTNLAVYKMPVGTSQSYLAVDDTATNSARMRGFMTMSAPWASSMTLHTLQSPIGTRPFPTDYQLAGGTYFLKSNAVNSTPRSWVLISNGKIFYLYVDCYSDGGAGSRTMVFGDIASYNTFDTNSCIIIGSHSDYNNYFMEIVNLATQPSHFLCQRWDENSWSIPFGKSPINGLHYAGVQMVMGRAGYMGVYPDPILGRMLLTPISIIESTPNGYVLRGRMPGLWAPLHPNGTMSTGDTVSGKVGTDVASRTFEAFRGGQYSIPMQGLYLLETSDTQDLINFGC